MAHILIVAGEASGDRLGGLLLREFHAISPGHTFFGIGSSFLKEQGVKILARSQELDIVGGPEGLSRLPRVYGVYSRLKRVIARREVDALLLIDYPGMNLRLARVAKDHGVPVVYYVSPQIWAWRPGRIKKIKDAVDLMMVILPFEEGLYRRAGVPVVYVGHPLVDVVRPEMKKEDLCRELSIPGDRELVALLPGSRRQELDYLMGEMAHAASLITQRREVSFLLPVAPTLPVERVKKQWAGLAWSKGVECFIMRDSTYSALAASQAALVASGTATLEAALLGTPQVLAYKVNPITYMVGKRLAKVKWLSLVNILLDKRVIPELIQSEATGVLMARKLEAILQGKDEDMKREFSRLREILGPPGASARAARQLAIFLKEQGL
jgi:lipid-A-disaccharide synthase